jgi:flagellin
MLSEHDFKEEHPMRINHNTSALNTYRQLSANNLSASKSMEKLSSGLRINRAADDAAGLSISEKMRGQIRSLDQAVRNSQDGVSFIQTAEGALNEVSDMLGRMRELNVQKANQTYQTADTANIDLELTSLGSAIGKVLSDTKFNGKAMLAGAFAGADITDNEGVAIVSIAKITFTGGMTSGSNLAAIDAAIDKVNTDRAQYGAYQNQLEHTVNNLNTTQENLTAAESRIRDVDMAKEMMAYTKNNILSQAATAMLAQANQAPQGVLQLLR